MNSNFFHSFGACQSTSTPIRSDEQGYYIDDYSHLRLSYYQAHRGHQGNQEHQGFQEHQGNQEHRGYQEHQGYQGSQEHRVYQESQEHRVYQGRQVHQGYQRSQGNQEFQLFQDGDDNPCDLRALHDDFYISSRGEHGLEGSPDEVSQNAAVDDDEKCGSSIISISSSSTYSSFEFIEHLHESESILTSPELSIISDNRILERTEDPRSFLGQVQNRSQKTNEDLASAKKWTEETKELIPPVHEEAWRTKLRNSYLASKVILPHPSQVAAGMIATASRRAGGHQFQYNDRVEPGSKVKMERICDDSIVFDPKRRSTLKYNYFRFY